MTDHRPLAGIRVLEIAKLIPTALTARKLADLGADVVKVERPPTGDQLRQIPPLLDGLSVYHRVLDRNKRSVLVDITDSSDRERLVKLILAADVVIDGSLPGALAVHGIDWKRLRAQKPSLVVCLVSGFGQTGPLASLPAHGLTMEALAGCLAVNEDEGGQPAVHSGWHASWAIELGTVNAALASTAAVLSARATGAGSVIDASCWDAGVETLRYDLTLRGATGAGMPQLRDYGPLYRPYRTADDRAFFFGALEDKFWRRFCDAIGRDDLVSMKAGGAVGFSRNEELEAELIDVFAGRTADEWLALVTEAQVPGGTVMDTPALLHSDALRERGLYEPGPSPTVADSICWMEPTSERVGAGATPAPAPGGGADDVLAEWTDT